MADSSNSQPPPDAVPQGASPGGAPSPDSAPADTSPPVDEFDLLAEAAAEAGLPPTGNWAAGTWQVRRLSYQLPGSDRRLSAIAWGSQPPELVLLHGGAQNARTWDTTLLALGRPALAVDLPGHGHSDWREDHDYAPEQLAQDVQHIVAELAPQAAGVVGMSLGGMTALLLAELQPQLVRRLALVDITPGVNRAKAEPILEFIGGQQTFDSFEEILGYTMEHNPTRSEASLRRGVLNNAKELADGRWTWRWDPTRMGAAGSAADSSADSPELAFGAAWDALESLQVPLLLLKGGTSGVVDEADLAEVLKRRPEAEVVVVPDAGHSIQGDQPVELAALLEQFIT